MSLVGKSGDEIVVQRVIYIHVERGEWAGNWVLVQRTQYYWRTGTLFGWFDGWSELDSHKHVEMESYEHAKCALGCRMNYDRCFPRGLDKHTHTNKDLYVTKEHWYQYSTPMDYSGYYNGVAESQFEHI